MIIYLDIILLKNFIINLIILKITDMILQEKSKLTKRICISLSTSIYSVVAITYNLRIASNTFGRLLLSTIIITVLYKPKDVAKYIEGTITLYSVTYYLGGVVESTITNLSNINLTIIVSLTIGSFLIFISKALIKKRMKRLTYTCDVKIIINEKTVIAKAFIDTGLQLQDVITGENVIIVNENRIEEISNNLYLALKGIVLNVPQEFQTRIRMITYNSLGNQGDVIYGVKADGIVVNYDGKEIESRNVIVAMNEFGFKDYDALIGLNVIEGGNVIGNTFATKVKC